MLPFLDKKKTITLIRSRRGDKSTEVKNEVEAGQGIDPSLKSAAESVLKAIEDKSVIDLAKAMRACWDACEGAGSATQGSVEEGQA